MKVYIAGPLFNEMEKARNIDIASIVESLGFETFLPQRDAGVFSDMVLSDKNIIEIRKNIFEEDLKAVKDCDIILCLLDGRTPDEGMCIELGIAYTLGKKCIAYCTDSRVHKIENINIILEGVLSEIFNSKEDLKTFLSSNKK